MQDPKPPQVDPDTDGMDEPEPLLDNDESESDHLNERYGSTNNTIS